MKLYLWYFTVPSNFAIRMLSRSFFQLEILTRILNSYTLNKRSRCVRKIMIQNFSIFSSIWIEFQFRSQQLINVNTLRSYTSNCLDFYVWKSEASLKYYRYRSSLDSWFEQLIFKLIKKVSTTLSKLQSRQLISLPIGGFDRKINTNLIDLDISKISRMKLKRPHWIISIPLLTRK